MIIRKGCIHIGMRGQRANLSDEQKRQMIQLYEDGESTRKIGKIFGVTKKTVIETIRKNGGSIRTPKEAKELIIVVKTCVMCGKSFRPYDIATYGNRGERQTCSDSCASALRKVCHKDFYLSPKRRVSASYGLQAANRLGIEKVCSICGTTENIHIHHKDRDRRNNEKENLMPLCRTCHDKYHQDHDNLKISKREDITFELVKEMTSSGLGVCDIARALDCSHPLISKRIKKWRGEGKDI